MSTPVGPKKPTPADLHLPELNAAAYLAEARRRLGRLTMLDLSQPIRRTLWIPPTWAEAQRWRLAEAWKRARAALNGLEHQLQARVAAASRHASAQALSAERFRELLLTHYCANILRYQAQLGQPRGVPARPVPAEWLQMAAAAAVVSVIQTALLLWVLNRAAGRPAHPRRRGAAPARLLRFHCLIPAPRAVSLPLRL